MIEYLVLDAIGYIAVHFFYSAIYVKTKDKTKYGMFVYILSYLCCNVAYVFADKQVVILVVNLFMFALICSNYTSKIILCVLGSVFMNIFGAIIESIVSVSMTVFYTGDYNIAMNDKAAYILGVAICKMAMIFASFNMYMVLKKRELFKRPGYFCIIAIIFPLCSIFILYFIFENVASGNLNSIIQVFAVTLSIFIMNIIVFVFYDQICNSQMVKEERDNLLHYIELQETEQQNVDSYNRNISKIRHDIKNYMIGISSLINQGKYDTALDEINKVSSEVVKKYDTVSTCDSVLNHVLNAKLWIMNEKNIRLERKLYITEELAMSAGELSVLLGNVLDNAIEYVGNHKGVEQLIRMDMSFDRGILMIGVQNRVEDEIIIPKDMIIKTTKADKGHGLGMKSIKEICDRYNGKFDVKCESGNFIVNMMMILPGDNK